MAGAGTTSALPKPVARLQLALSRRAVADAAAKAALSLSRTYVETDALRRRWRDFAAQRALAHTDNLQDPHAWAIYAFYTDVVARLVADRDARIVDWGGLYGHVASILRARGFRNTTNYLLHEPPAYEETKFEFDVPTVYGREPNALALESESVDAFLSSGTLEHVHEDGEGREEAVLREVRRVLRPGGLLAVWNLPTALAPADLAGKLRGAWYHETRYTEREVRRLVEAAGLRLVHLERHGGTPLGVALKRAGADPAGAFCWDRAAANAWPLSTFAQNFAFFAVKA